MTAMYGISMEFLGKIRTSFCVDWEELVSSKFDFVENGTVLVISEKNVLAGLVYGMSIGYLALSMLNPGSVNGGAAHNIGKAKGDALRILINNMPGINRQSGEEYTQSLRKHYAPTAKRIYALFIKGIENGDLTNGVVTWEQ